MKKEIVNNGRDSTSLLMGAQVVILSQRVCVIVQEKILWKK